MSGFSEEGVKVDFVKVWAGKVCERGCGGLISSSRLTGGQAAVGATQIDVAFRDGCHA